MKALLKTIAVTLTMPVWLPLFVLLVIIVSFGHFVKEFIKSGEALFDEMFKGGQR